MPFTPKDWRDATGHDGGGDTTTPLTAAALEDMETRLSAYSDSLVSTGGWTVSITNTANIAASSALTGFYVKILDFVVLGTRITIDPTSAGVSTEVQLSLPVASDLTNGGDAFGVAVPSGTAAATAIPFAVLPDTASNLLRVVGVPPLDTSQNYHLFAGYQVI
jgi:hypothetical protein